MTFKSLVYVIEKKTICDTLSKIANADDNFKFD